MAVSRRSARKQVKVSPGISEWLKAFLIALVILVLIRFLIFDFVSVTGSGMAQTVLPGDIVIVNKYDYGARMPMRILPHKTADLFLNTDSLPSARQLPYWRFPGYYNPDYNDLVLVNIPAPHHKPIDKRSQSVLRMVGLPGDVFEIKNSRIIINDKETELQPALQWNYQVEIRRGTDIEKLIDQFGLKEGFKIKGRNSFNFPLTREMADSLSSLREVAGVRLTRPGYEAGFVSPFGNSAQKWTQDNFGPFTIPYKGYTVKMDPHNVDLYQYHIKYHERRSLSLRNDSVFIENRFAETYTFKNDYYFVLGDNRHNSSDSRLWGFVPESHIKGRVKSVFLSFDKDARFFNKVRWKRLFRAIDNLS